MTEHDELVRDLRFVIRRLSRLPDFGEEMEVIEDAICVLEDKNRYARLLTKEQMIDRFTTGAPWYCEVNSEVSRAGDGWELPIVARNTEIESVRVDGIRHNTYQVRSDVGNYGSVWRCWTAMPTEEQSKAVKWDV